MADRTRYRDDWRDYNEEYPAFRRGPGAPRQGNPFRDTGYGEPGFETRGRTTGYPDDGSPAFYDEHGPRWVGDLDRRPPSYGPADWNDVYGGDHRGPRRRFDEDRRRQDEPHDRGFIEKAADEVSSWFGDDEAARRRDMDQHRGRGPKGYVRSGARIHEDVCDRLADDWVVDASEVEVRVDGTEVTLTGTVETREQRRRAEDCAEAVSGVTHVQNNLRVLDRRQQPYPGRSFL